MPRWSKTPSFIVDPAVITRAEAKARGLEFYYTTDRCLYGHIAERRTSDCKCTRCLDEKPPELTAKQRAQSKAWGIRHKDIVREYRRKYAQMNRERLRERKRSWAEKNREKIRASRRAYQKRKPEMAAARQRNRHARERGAQGCHSVEQIKALFIKQHAKCANCFRSIAAKYHVDHIMPLSRAGSNDITNIQLLCPTCNMRKHNKHPDVWASEQWRLL